MNQNWYSAFRELAYLIKEYVCSFFPCRICHPAYVSCRWPLTVDWVNVLYCNIPKVSSGDSWQWNGLRQWTGSACLKLFCHSQGWIGWSRSHSPKMEVRWPFHLVVLCHLLLVCQHEKFGKDSPRGVIYFKDQRLPFVDLYQFLWCCWGALGRLWTGSLSSLSSATLFVFLL